MEDLTLKAATRASVTRMEHVHLSVADAARSIDFYRSAFGWEVRWEEADPAERCAHVGSDAFYVALSEEPGLAPSAPSETARILHVGLVTGDLDALRERLRREGLCEGDRDEVYARKEGRAIYVYDPDGHEIEVVEYAKGYPYA